MAQIAEWMKLAIDNATDENALAGLAIEVKSFVSEFKLPNERASENT